MQKVKVDSFQVVGLAQRTSNANGQAAREIAELWGRFVQEQLVAQIPNRVDDTIYSLYTDYEGDHTQPYTVLLGCRVANTEQIPEGMESRTIRGGEYVKFNTRGDLNDGIVVEQWHKIWNSNLPRAYTSDYEVWDARAQNPADAEIDFYIALDESA